MTAPRDTLRKSGSRGGQPGLRLGGEDGFLVETLEGTAQVPLCGQVWSMQGIRAVQDGWGTQQKEAGSAEEVGKVGGTRRPRAWRVLGRH